jgi:predicted anti-sigma-YlaC factor YlaD
MDCDMARQAVSARIDGEDPGLPLSATEAHLAGCGGCRGWQERAHLVTRSVRLGGSFLDHDLTPRLLAAIPSGDRSRRLRQAPRTALGILAAAQLLIAVPMLILGRCPGAGVLAAHELGSFDMALAVAFAVGAIRPALSAGLAWPSVIAAAGLVAAAAADLVAGHAISADDAQSLIAAAGAALLVWQTRTSVAGTSSPAVVSSSGHAAVPPDAAEAWLALLPGSPPDHAPGDGTAQVTGQDIAANSVPAAARAPGAKARMPPHPGQDGSPFLNYKSRNNK